MMGGLSPEKILLLAAYLAAQSEIGQLATLALQNAYVLRKEILLRILLTYLPETVDPQLYVGFLRDISDEQLRTRADVELDTCSVDDLSDEKAAKKAKKLHLLPLVGPNVPSDLYNDSISLFIVGRTYRISSEAGLPSQLPELLEPFLDRSVSIKHWAASTVFPFVRRTCEYYPSNSPDYTLLQFESLPDRAAAIYLLSESASGDRDVTGRDLRSVVSPWLYSDVRWKNKIDEEEVDEIYCPGWEQVREIILARAAKSWISAAGAINDWGGPQDVYFGENVILSLAEDKIRYMERGYTTTAIACIYSISDSSTEALRSSYQMCCTTHTRLGQTEPLPVLDSIVSNMSLLPMMETRFHDDPKIATFMRHNLLQASNPLTAATTESLQFVTALTISAFISTSFGVPWSVRKAGDLLLLGDVREQKGELNKLLRAIAAQAPRDNDHYWIRSRDGILWLVNWGNRFEEDDTLTHGRGPLGMIPREYIETEILKMLLSNSKYTVSRAIYQDGPERTLARDKLQDAIYHSALNAFDNASNPNKNGGGLRKCDEIIHSLPKLLHKSSPLVRRVEALIKTSHALSEYRLVLQQGEPFSPVVLRVHSDTVIIIEKVLDQNPKAYTRLQEFLEVGASMVSAGLTSPGSFTKEAASQSETERELAVAEKRIVAMCIEAALKEDDFETAYSYVVSRLGDAVREKPDLSICLDNWSWSAALKAGQYIRTERSQQPTHLGTASGNLEMRHLEQRIECLATALRAAPPAELQRILKSFRRCEEQLDSAIREEVASEAAWEAARDLNALPGSFEGQVRRSALPPRYMTTGAAAGQGEDAPMSLLDLSRATARIARRNLTALSGLQGVPSSPADRNTTQEQQGARTRKRDQLRDAATGTLVSGVGWLIGANMSGGSAGNE